MQSAVGDHLVKRLKYPAGLSAPSRETGPSTSRAHGTGASRTHDTRHIPQIPGALGPHRAPPEHDDDSGHATRRRGGHRARGGRIGSWAASMVFILELLLLELILLRDLTQVAMFKVVTPIEIHA